MTEVLSAYAVFVLPPITILLVVVVYFRGILQKERTEKERVLDSLNTLKEQLDQKERQFQECLSTLQGQQHLNIRLEEQLAQVKNSYEIHLQNETRQAEHFELIANRILQLQSSQFSKVQQAQMLETLNPLRSEIREFKDRMEKSNLDATEKMATLKEQIRNLSQRTDQVSRDANNLAKALKGDYKQQGNWGEIILESILEKSGLEKDREYFTQNSFRNEEGQLKRPDVIINLPGKKSIIIDSKVTLSAYDRIINASDEDEAHLNLGAHVVNIRNHVNHLAAKNYHEIYKMESPDFVLMFIPIDTAFSIALQKDPELYGYAFDKNVVIVTSSTLLATLKTVDTIWKNEKYNNNALKIAEEAGKMYDKLEALLRDLEKMGNQLQTVRNTFDGAMKKISVGQGNLLGKARKIEALGIKASRKIDYEAIAQRTQSEGQG